MTRLGTNGRPRMSRTLWSATPRRAATALIALGWVAVLAAAVYANEQGMRGSDSRPRLRGSHFLGSDAVREFQNPQIGSGLRRGPFGVPMIWAPPTICDRYGCVTTEGTGGVIRTQHHHR